MSLDGKESEEDAGENLRSVASLSPTASESFQNPKNTWGTMYKQLLDYVQQKGNSLVPTHCKENPQLGKWVSSQRTSYKKNTLTKMRMKLLNDVGFVWSIIPNHSWGQMYSRLLEFKTKHGHCLVPQDYKEIKTLGRWVKEQRFIKATLSLEQVRKLDDIGFVWNPHDKMWDDMYQRLVKYKQRKGNCLVPRRYAADPKLGSWVYTQRGCFLQKSLSEERIQRLEQIDFVWRIRPINNRKGDDKPSPASQQQQKREVVNESSSQLHAAASGTFQGKRAKSMFSQDSASDNDDLPSSSGAMSFQSLTPNPLKTEFVTEKEKAEAAREKERVEAALVDDALRAYKHFKGSL